MQAATVLSCCVSKFSDPYDPVIASRILIRFELADDRPDVYWPRPDLSRCLELPHVDICDRHDQRDLAWHRECCVNSMSTVGRLGGFRR